MKALTAMLAGTLAVTWAADAMAASNSKKRYYRSYDSYQYETRRSNTTAYNGTCQRDTGIHTSNLNFRNRCDTLEFWERMNRNQGGRR